MIEKRNIIEIEIEIKQEINVDLHQIMKANLKKADQN